MIWDPRWEQADRGTLEGHQLELLREQVKRCFALPYYRRKMQDAGLSPCDIKSLDDLRLLPFTTKKDFMDNYPFGMFAVPLNEVVRVQGSSGTTTGKSSIAGYTRNDISTWSNLCARLATAAGVGSQDIAQVSFGYGLFTGGFGLHGGLERIGALVIPLSSGNTARQIKFMMDMKSTALISTPTYALRIAEIMKEQGISSKDLFLKWGLFGGEPWSEAIRQQIDAQLGLIATDNYGMSEVMGPGVSYECLQRNGMHVAEDHFIIEIINPETGETVPEGEVGEVVLTTTTKEAVPVIRYRTRDLSRILPGKCPCGRSHRRMEKVRGRSDDMLIIRGVNVFPTQIEGILLSIEHTEPHYQIVLTKRGALDVMEIQVEVTEEIFHDEMRRLKQLEEEIRYRLKNELNVECQVKLVEPRSLQRFEGKARRVVDNR
ncbi:MAG TPA: phenylacetate--CoA ligase [Candidatus Sumerlaeota bacterium]|nr:phenylacetate--CoA ligase [Candidatus Sumerlaeota bacterium]